jgi:hypothetical protein
VASGWRRALDFNEGIRLMTVTDLRRAMAALDEPEPLG